MASTQSSVVSADTPQRSIPAAPASASSAAGPIRPVTFAPTANSRISAITPSAQSSPMTVSDRPLARQCSAEKP